MQLNCTCVTGLNQPTISCSCSGRMRGVAVFLPGRQDCVSGRPVPVPGSSGHLASLATGETGCGATDTAWLIDAGPGQTIVISLLDFSVSSNSSSRTTHRHRVSNGPIPFAVYLVLYRVAPENCTFPFA